MKFLEKRSGLFIASGGWAIRRDGNESPAYWTAFRPDAHGKPCLAPQHELGAGAGDQGWLKCMRLCESHQRSEVPPSSSNTETPQQQGLKL